MSKKRDNDDGGDFVGTPKQGEHMPKKNVEITPTSIRLPAALLRALKKLAEQNGLGYQNYVRMLLTQHVAECKPNKMSSPS